MTKPKAVAASAKPGRRQGIQSVEVAGPLLATLAAVESPMMLRDLAAAAGMPAAKAHRYLVSLARLGLITQDETSGRYDLGPFALELGLSALNRQDAFKPASRAMERLRDELGETAGLVAWGTHGATYVRIVEPLRAVTVSLRAGVVAPLTASAAGYVFFAWLPPAATAALMEKEIGGAPPHARAGLRSSPKSKKTMEAIARRVRAEGLAYAVSAFAPGINSYAAPVFDHMGRVPFAMTVIGHAGHLGAGPATAVAVALLREARAVSAELGYGGASA